MITLRIKHLFINPEDSNSEKDRKANLEESKRDERGLRAKRGEDRKEGHKSHLNRYRHFLLCAAKHGRPNLELLKRNTFDGVNCMKDPERCVDPFLIATLVPSRFYRFR